MEMDLTWRELDRNDQPAVMELGKACLAVDGGLGFLFADPEHVQGRFFPEAPFAATGAFDPHGRLEACATVQLAGRPGAQRAVIVGHVRPERRGQGIGDYLMRWSQSQGRALLAAAGGVLVVRSECLTEAAERLYRRHDFERVFEELVMRRSFDSPLPDRPLPPGVSLVAWQPELGAQFYRAYYPAFQDRPGFPGWSQAEWIAQAVDNDMIPAWTLLALAGDEPAGFVIGCIDQTTTPPGGYIQQTGVVPEWRRRGLVSAILTEMMRRAQAGGAPWTELTVHVNNPGAIAAYERLGFETVGKRARYEKIP